jgi:hypothetical protein
MADLIQLISDTYHIPVLDLVIDECCGGSLLRTLERTLFGL